MQNDNRNNLYYNPIEAIPIKHEQQAQTCQTQELEKQSKIDKVIEEQSVLSQVTRKPKLKTDALPNTNKQIIRPKLNIFHFNPLICIYLDQIWSQGFKIWRHYIACFDIFMIFKQANGQGQVQSVLCIYL